MTIKWLEFAKNMHSLNDRDVFSVYPTKSVGRNGPESNELHKNIMLLGKPNPEGIHKQTNRVTIYKIYRAVDTIIDVVADAKSLDEHS